MVDKRAIALERSFPDVLIESKENSERDISRLIALTAAHRSLYPDGFLSKYTQTYAGNFLHLVQTSLARDIVSTIDRLFAKPSRNHNSLLAAAEIFKKNKDARRVRARLDIRHGASGSFSVLENGKIRERTLTETLSERKQNARRAKTIGLKRLEAAIEAVESFPETTEYKKVRVFRSERISHNVAFSDDRKRANFSKDDDITTEELLAAAEAAAAIAERAFLGLFKTHLGLSSLNEVWAGYAQAFWASCDPEKAE